MSGNTNEFLCSLRRVFPNLDDAQLSAIVRVMDAAFQAEAIEGGWRPLTVRYRRVDAVLEAAAILVRSLALASRVPRSTD